MWSVQQAVLPKARALLPSATPLRPSPQYAGTSAVFRAHLRLHCSYFFLYPLPLSLLLPRTFCRVVLADCRPTFHPRIPSAPLVLQIVRFRRYPLHPSVYLSASAPHEQSHHIIVAVTLVLGFWSPREPRPFLPPARAAVRHATVFHFLTLLCACTSLCVCTLCARLSFPPLCFLPFISGRVYRRRTISCLMVENYLIRATTTAVTNWSEKMAEEIYCSF